MGAEQGPGGVLVEVEFSLQAAGAETVAVAGDFNDWSPSTDQLTRGEDGCWRTTVLLPPGRHPFRYVIDGHRWENDAAADDYEPNDLGEENSVKVVTDVSDAQARAIAQETSAEQIKPDTELVAPTTGGPDTSSGGAPQRREPTPADPQDGRQMQQGSGQPSPSIGEQQAGKQGTA